jgi:hypothetical protein
VLQSIVSIKIWNGMSGTLCYGVSMYRVASDESVMEIREIHSTSANCELHNAEDPGSTDVHIEFLANTSHSPENMRSINSIDKWRDLSSTSLGPKLART